jgi:hypothetical protein
MVQNEFIVLRKSLVSRPFLSSQQHFANHSNVLAQDVSRKTNLYGELTMTSNRPPETRPPNPTRERDRNPSARRRSRIMLRGSLAIVLAGHAAVGAFFIVFSAPFVRWAWAMAGAVVGAGAEAWVLSWVGPFCGGWLFGLAVGWALVLARVGVLAVGMALVSGPVGMALALARCKLLECSSQSHTFLILAGTSLAGLYLGWLIGTVLRLFSVLPS